MFLDNSKYFLTKTSKMSEKADLFCNDNTYIILITYCVVWAMEFLSLRLMDYILTVLKQTKEKPVNK